MCIARITEMGKDLWGVEAILCHGNPARSTIVSAPRWGEKEAMGAARVLLRGKDCGTITEEVVRKAAKHNLFGPN